MNDRGTRKPGAARGLGGTRRLGGTRGSGATGGLGMTRGLSVTRGLGGTRGSGATGGLGAPRGRSATRRLSASATCCYQGCRPVPAARAPSASASCCYPAWAGGRSRAGSYARFTEGRGASRGHNVETPHLVETSHAYSVFYFRRMQSFHANGGLDRTAAAASRRAHPKGTMLFISHRHYPTRGAKHPATSTSRAGTRASCCYLLGHRVGRTARSAQEGSTGASCCYLRARAKAKAGAQAGGVA